MDTTEFAGIWKSRYRYYSHSRKSFLYSEHMLRCYPLGRHLVLESVPEVSASYVVIRLSLDNDIATGSWLEQTEEHGDYEGAIYSGALQLQIAKDKKHMKGKWIGFGRNAKINHGPWEFTYVGERLPEELARGA